MNDTLSPSLLIGFYFFEFLILTMGEFASALKLSFYLLIFMYNYLKLLLFFLPFFFHFFQMQIFIKNKKKFSKNLDILFQMDP